MSGAPSSTTTSSKFHQAVPLRTVNKPTQEESPALEDNDGQKPRSLSRPWNPLEYHATAVRSGPRASEGDSATRRPMDRREGYTWGITDNDPANPPFSQRSRAPTPVSPPPLEEVMRTLSKHLRTDVAPQSGKRMSVASTTTSRSSFSLGFGSKRRTSDCKVLSADKTPKHNSDDRSQDQSEKFVPKRSLLRKLTFQLPASKIEDNFEAPRSAKAVEERSEEPCERKGGLKARRNLDLVDSLKLILPLDVPEVPVGTRSSASKPELNLIGAPRNRSPKTPFVRPCNPIYDSPTNREAVSPEPCLLPGNDPIDSSQSPEFVRPPQRIRDRCYISRPKFRRGRSGTSDSSLAKTPDGSYTPESDTKQKRTASEEDRSENMKVLGKRAQRWRWGVWSSDQTGNTETSSQNSERRHSSKNPFKIPKRSGRLESSTEDRSPKSGGLFPWRQRNSSPPLTPSKPSPLSNVPRAPTFEPPGMKRVPTPPIYDSNGELKGKLADYFFDFQEGPAPSKRPKLRPGSGRIWDSDALLMSQDTSALHSSSSESDPGPRGERSSRDTTTGDPNFDDTSLASPSHQRGFLAVKPLSVLHKPPSSYFRVKVDSEAPTTTFPVAPPDIQVELHDPAPERSTTPEALRTEEARARFKWLVPEHLPSSPLCPLHEKYVGPSKGLCLWHHRQKVSGSFPRHHHHHHVPAKISPRSEYAQSLGRSSGGGHKEWGVGRGRGKLTKQRGRWDSVGVSNEAVSPLVDEDGSSEWTRKRRLVSLSNQS